MKNVILLIFLSLYFYSCNSDIETSTKSNLVGKWIWVSSCGGLTGGCWYPNQNNTKTIEFTDDFSYIEWTNHNIRIKIRSNRYNVFRL